MGIVCVLRGHSFVNEVQTVAQIFFGRQKVELRVSHPSVPLCDKSSLGPDVLIATCFSEGAAHAAVYVNGTEAAVHSVRLDEPGVVAAGLGARRVLMLAMFHALQGVFPVEAPWGALTGIRPSKMVRAWLDEGKSDAEVFSAMENVLCVHPGKARLALDVAYAEKRLTARIFAAAAPLGIYIGIPFCPGRCAYCSFNTAHRPPTREELARYIHTLLRECRAKEAEARRLGGAIVSVYIGGGTPTVLPDDLLAKLLDAVGSCFNPTKCEYTIEAGRADTLTVSNLRLMRRHGANRIAVNPQTLNDHTLAAIGRNHTAADFFRAFALAREAGFECINTDLIAHLPGEGADDLMRSIEGLLPLAPENITLHTLSVKRASKLNETRAAQEPPAPPKTAPSQTQPPALAAARYAPYYLYRQKNTVNLAENIGFALPGYECLYNIGMMSEVHTILGIGAGAVSKYVEGTKISRVFNEKNPAIYIQRRE